METQLILTGTSELDAGKPAAPAMLEGGAIPASPKKGKRSTPKTPTQPTGKDLPVSPPEAADILGVALGYCLKAHIPMQYIEKNGTLWISFGGLTATPLPNGKLEINVSAQA